MSNSLFNQLLAKGYRITFTESQVMYSAPDSEVKTIQYTGDFDSVLEAISSNKPEVLDDDAIINLCQKIINNVQNPWEGPLMHTLPFDGGVIKINPPHQFSQTKELQITFDGVKGIMRVSTKIYRLLQPHGLVMYWVMYARLPTMLITSKQCSQRATSGLQAFPLEVNLSKRK